MSYKKVLEKLKTRDMFIPKGDSIYLVFLVIKYFIINLYIVRNPINS